MTQLAEQKGAHLSNFARIGEQDARGGNGASRPPAWLGAYAERGAFGDHRVVQAG